MALELCNETHFAGSPHTIHSCRHVPGRALQQMPCLGRALQQTPCLSWGSRRTHLGTWSLSANASGTASASMRTPRGKRRPWVHHRWRAAGTRLLPELSRCPMPGSLSRHVAHLCPAAAVSRNVIRDSLLSVTKLQQLCLRSAHALPVGFLRRHQPVLGATANSGYLTSVRGFQSLQPPFKRVGLVGQPPLEHSRLVDQPPLGLRRERFSQRFGVRGQPPLSVRLGSPQPPLKRAGVICQPLLGVCLGGLQPLLEA
mmetsp:Transcript_37341/g.110264  ORF Transcript_37341/g.110264 Transcript_37341/m.110264 type:complete len:256 (-) Transcript_37341:995-1762(-)